MKTLGPLVRIETVEPLELFRVRIQFADGTIKVVDLEPYLRGPIFDPIRNDPSVFRSVKVRGNTVAWDNGADIDPDVLYYDLKPEWMEETETTR